MTHFKLVLGLFIVSCGASSDHKSESGSPSGTTSQNKSCLAKMEDPATWLPQAKAESLINLPGAEIKQKVYKTIECQYNWKSDRKYTMKIGNGEVQVDANNMIAVTIKNLDTEIEKWLAHSYVKETSMTYEEYFNKFHGPPMTTDDKKEINKKLDAKAEKDENFDKKSAETAKGMLAMAGTENFTELKDLGDQANYYVQLAPNLRELRLAVLTGNVVLLVNVDASDDDNVDLALAKKAAEAVMANCR